jgi:hypothetical protein
MERLWIMTMSNCLGPNVSFLSFIFFMDFTRKTFIFYLVLFLKFIVGRGAASKPKAGRMEYEFEHEVEDLVSKH